MQVEITKKIKSTIISALRNAGRMETGGVIFAEQLEPGFFKIVELTIDKVMGSEAQFVRSPDHYQVALKEFFDKTNDFSRYNYLGEWHSHPNHAPFPSSTDIQSMRGLVNSEENISFALLLIVRKSWWKRLECSATMFQYGQAHSVVNVKFLD